MDLLDSPIQPYPWGSTTALPALLGVPPTGEPQAELWMGAHERAPSTVERDGRRLGLDAVIAQDPVAELGPQLSEAAIAGPGRLPFLAKVLAVAAPLSLQLHPDTAQAQRGYAEETAAGVPADSPARSFPDPCAKPELIYAVDDFRALCGWAPVEETAAVLAELALPGLRPWQEALADRGAEALRDILGRLLRMPRSDAAPLIAMVQQSPRCPPVSAQLAEEYPDDPAVLATLGLRLVELAAGQTMFAPPGRLHCYLSGVAVEVQANSDNVVRAGLTSKHIDVDLVLALVETAADETPSVTSVIEGVETCYDPGVPHFALGVVESVPHWSELAAVPGPAVLFCLRGEYEIDDGTPAALRQGRSAYVSAAADGLRVRGSGTLLRVTKGLRHEH